MRTAYVTGGTGCVGRNLVNELLKDKWHVIVAHRRSSDTGRLAGLAVELREVDLRDEGALLRSVPEGATAIFHVAANLSHWILDKDEQWKDNVLGTRNLVNVALARKVNRFILTSTGATARFAKTSRAEAERIKLQYVRTKRLSELEVEEGINRGLNAVFLHPEIVMGPFDYNCYSKIFTMMQSGTLQGVFPGSIEFCGAKAVARAHVSAFEKGHCGTHYSLSGPRASWLEVYQKIARMVGVPPPKKQTSILMLYAISYSLLLRSYFTRKPPIFTPDLIHLFRAGSHTTSEAMRKSEEDLGYDSPSLDQMLGDCYQWLLHNGMLRPNKFG